MDLDSPSTEPVNITVSANLAQGGMVTGGGVYNFGETCTVTATVNAGYYFIGWMENGELVTKNLEFSFSAVRDRDLVATFGEDIFIGDGGNETNMTLPNYSGYRYSLSQQIYTANEIGTAGTINSITFYNEGMQRTRSYDMYLVHTDKNAFESIDDWIVVTEADKVFSGSVNMVADVWTVINFDTPFEYDGMSNLALVMDDNTNADNFGISCRVFDTEDTQAIRVYSDNVNYNPMEPPTHCTSGDHPGLLSEKNQIILGITVSKTFTKEIIGYGEGDGHYYLIAPPIGEVSPAEVTNMLNTTNGYDLYYFDQAQDLEWINYKAGSFNLEPGKGYLYANSENVVLSFIGTQYNGNGEVIISKASGTEFEGWNIVGNPFSENAYIDRDFYIINDDGTEIIPASDIERDYIEPMEGVFVIAEQDQETLTFSTTAPNNKGSMIVLDLTQGHGIIDRAIVRFSQDRMLPKFQINKNSSKIYIPMDGQDYAVVRSEGMGEIPVNFNAKKNGTYMLSLSSEEVEFSYLHLIDNMTGADIDLLVDPSYSFEAKTTDYASRFKLVFVSGDASDDNDFAFISNGNIIVNGEGTLQVIDLLGRQLSSQEIHSTSHIQHSALPSGVYVLRLINGNDVKTQKIVVR